MAKIDDELKSKFDNDKHRFIANLVFTAGWVKNKHVEVFKPFGLSSAQFNILRILRGANDWLPMSQVKERMVERSPNATRLADKILAKELLERKRSDQDRRVVYVRITQKGLDILDLVDEKLKELDFDFFNNFTNKEARKISKFLDKIRE